MAVDERERERGGGGEETKRGGRRGERRGETTVVSGRFGRSVVQS